MAKQRRSLAPKARRPRALTLKRALAEAECARCRGDAAGLRAALSVVAALKRLDALAPGPAPKGSPQKIEEMTDEALHTHLRRVILGEGRGAV